MNIQRALLALSITAAFAGTCFAQQSAQSLPDGPTPTAAAMIHPNGPMAVIDTSMGRITCQFFEKQAPAAVANFVGLANGAKDYTDPTTNKKVHGKRYFDGTTFHRVIPEFMIQGGDPTGTGMGDPGYSFNDEFDPNLNFDVPGRLAMANSGPNTNGSQFFITEQAYDSLNQHYTIFGQCDDSSVTVVKAIARVPTGPNDKPVTPVILKTVTIVPEAGTPPPQADGAPSKVERPKRVAISAGVVAGMLQTKSPPPYPLDAKNARVSGTVVLGAVIGADGTVKELHIVSGPEPLQQSAFETVKTWRYKPFLLNGEPIEVITQINVVFTLGRN